MRKLYVAVTRAEEKLFLVGSYKNEESAWLEWAKRHIIGKLFYQVVNVLMPLA
ncbi:hypothetical protein AB6817_04000 [Carnobacterium maltaromaticum]